MEHSRSFKSLKEFIFHKINVLLHAFYNKIIFNLIFIPYIFSRTSWNKMCISENVSTKIFQI